MSTKGEFYNNKNTFFGNNIVILGTHKETKSILPASQKHDIEMLLNEKKQNKKNPKPDSDLIP